MRALALAIIAFSLAVAFVYPGPRFPRPETPDQVWQNDLDLLDRIRVAERKIRDLEVRVYALENP